MNWYLIFPSYTFENEIGPVGNAIVYQLRSLFLKQKNLWSKLNVSWYAENASKFFTIRGCTPCRALGCLRNVCTPLNPMFYCLDLDYRRGLFRHDFSDVPSQVFVLFSGIFLFSFVDARNKSSQIYSWREIYSCSSAELSDRIRPAN